jgi:transposase
VRGPALGHHFAPARFFAWIGRNRRLAKDFEATVDSARAFLYAASIMLLVRRLARAS